MFGSFLEIYRVVAEYMEYYNPRRRHGSLRYMAPNNFYQAFLDKIVDFEPFSA
jgi:putative transposase